MAFHLSALTRMRSAIGGRGLVGGVLSALIDRPDRKETTMISIHKLFASARFLALAAVVVGLTGSRAQAQTGLSFHPLTPCRVWDTRFSHPTPSPHAPNSTRDFVVKGLCGVPATAQAVAINVTIVGPMAAGNLRIYPAGLTTPPLASLLNWAAGDSPIANGTIVRLGDSGGKHLTVKNDSTGTVNTLADVTGYFQ